MSKYTPHTKEDIKKMLDTVNVRDVKELFGDVPDKIRLKKGLNIEKGKSQPEVMDKMRALSAKNKVFRTVLRGAGSYDHYIPSCVNALSSRSEFVTAYTPYQPEISQGILQGIFEYQTMMTRLTGMDICNASHYDVGTAAAEAVIMCAEKRKKVVIAGAVNAQTVEVIKTYCNAVDLDVVTVPHKGLVDLDLLSASCDADTACVVAQSPNYFGLIEDMDRIAEIAKEKQAKFIYIFNPFSAALLKTPADSGADIAVGEGQPLGLPMNFGGPYLGILTCKQALSRRMPGRIVGETVDKEGRRSFVLTLQAREQHIRREKALSSICSNQAHCALTATIYLSTMGDEFVEAARQCVSKAHYLADGLMKTGKVKLCYKSEFFHEFLVECKFDVDKFNKKLASKGILGGLKIESNKMLWCVTEKASKETLDTVINLAGGAE